MKSCVRLWSIVVTAMLCLGAAGQSLETQVKAGSDALAAGDIDRAFDIFCELLREYPDDPAVNLGLGRAAYERGKLSHAAFAYERVLLRDPGNHVARLELARTYYAMNQFDLAQAEFSRVLGHDPPPAVRGKVELFLQKIKQQTRAWDHWGRIEISAFGDDNVNFGPSVDSVSTIIGVLEVSEKSLPRTETGLAAALSLLGMYDVGRKGGWSALGGMNYYQNWLHEPGGHETLFLKLYGGMRRVTGRTWLQIPLKIEHIRYGHAPLLDSYGVNASCLYAQSGVLHWMTTFACEYRDYPGGTARDAPYVALGETARFYLTRRRHSLACGLKLFGESPDEQSYQNQGWEARLVGEAVLPWCTTLYVRIKCRETYYNGRALLDAKDEDRHDTYAQLTVGGSKMLRGALGVNGSYQVIVSDSSFDLYEYDRNVASAGVFWGF